MKGHNPQHLLRLRMLDFPLILPVRLSVVDRIQPQSSMFLMGVENEATGDSKLDLYVKLLITAITATIIMSY